MRRDTEEVPRLADGLEQQHAVVARGLENLSGTLKRRHPLTPSALQRSGTVQR
jgi:hypothetical protein